MKKLIIFAAVPIIAITLGITVFATSPNHNPIQTTTNIQTDTDTAEAVEKNTDKDEIQNTVTDDLQAVETNTDVNEIQTADTNTNNGNDTYYPHCIDADNDGICDNHGTNCPQYIDEDNDGICDHCRYGNQANGAPYSRGYGRSAGGHGAGHHGGYHH